MAGTRDIKRQIVSVQNTQKVTKAMKMVSAAKMRRSTDAMYATRPYAEKIREVVSNLAGGAEEITNPFMTPREEVKTIALLLINSDRGLCGAFNSNIIRLAAAVRAQNPDKEFKLFIVGKNAYDFFKKRDLRILESWTALGGKISYETAKGIASKISAAYLNGEFDELFVLYNEFRSAATQYPKASKLIPLSFEAVTPAEGAVAQTAEEEGAASEYMFEPAPKMLLDELVPRFINFSVYHSLLESAAGEHGARMVAMDNATRSADEMIKKLVLNYNKARQAAITTDLLDIVNGAEALK